MRYLICFVLCKNRLSAGTLQLADRTLTRSQEFNWNCEFFYFHDESYMKILHYPDTTIMANKPSLA